MLSTKYYHYLKCIALSIAIGLFTPYAMAERINLNKANAETLQYIPGIGPVKSEQIIALREELNNFENYQQLLEIQGIGKKILEVIQEYGSLDSGVTQLTPEMLEQLAAAQSADSNS